MCVRGQDSLEGVTHGREQMSLSALKDNSQGRVQISQENLKQKKTKRGAYKALDY